MTAVADRLALPGEELLLLRPIAGAPELFALPLAAAREVVRPPPVTPVPRVDPAIRGLLLLRGRLVTVVDLGARLGFREGLGPWTAPERRAVVLAAPAARVERSPRRGRLAGDREELVAIGVDAVVAVWRAQLPRGDDDALVGPLVETPHGVAALLRAAALPPPERP